ncbi:MAG: methyltransferase family protein [Acidobacteriota bacterium]
MKNLQKIRVPAGFAYAALFLIFAGPHSTWFAVGIGIALLGMALRIWASGHIEKGRKLAVSGPYRWTRSPLYFGSFLLGLGLTLAGSQLWLVLLFTSFFLLIYLPVMHKEEKELRRAFGAEFEAYRREVPLFLPGLRVRRSSDRPETSNFQWRLVILNREYNAVIGLIFFAVLIYLKMV